MMRVFVGLIVAGAAVIAMAQIKWAPNYKAALKQAKAANKIVMIEFYTAWDLDPNYVKDSPGQKLENDTFKDATAQKVANKFVPVRINVEKEGKELGKKFHITNYPTVLFVDSKENAVGIIDGYEDATEFVKHGNQFLKDYADMPKIEAAVKANPKNLPATARLGLIYANRYQIGAALAKLAQAEKIDPTNKTGNLSELYNGIGDYYQNASQFDTAITYFKKAATTSKVTDILAYSNLSIVACHFSMSRIGDLTGPPDAQTMKGIREHLQAARPYVEATLKLPKLKQEDKNIALQDKRTIDQVLNGSPDDGG